MQAIMDFPNIDPVFLRIGPVEFRWYGLMYVASFILVYLLLIRNVSNKKIPLTKDDIADLVFYLALGVIIGGRIGYVLFYNLPLYLSHPLSIFAVWEGGMSFHGGFVGTVLASIYFVRRKKITFLQLADLCAPLAPIGLFLGRLGNFINGELYGRVSHVPWAMVFPGGGPEPRHPSQLYEAILEGPLLFFLLGLIQRKKDLPRGVVFWSFIALYGAFRFMVEFTREPDAQIGYLWGLLSMGQLLSFPMFLLGVVMIILLFRGDRKGRVAQTQ